MKPPLRPTDEAHRLETLRRYKLLDTLPEPVLDDLTALAANICAAPISLISVIDEKRQWFKSRVGLSVGETPREISFCGHTILQRDLFIVPDAAQDERFADNPLVTGDPRIRFYAGTPLVAPDGQALGTICVIDREPRELSPLQQEALRALGRQVMAQLELRRQTRELAENERLLRAIFDSEPECVKMLGPDGSLRMMNRAGLAMIEADSFGQVAGQCVYPLVVPEHRAKFEELTKGVFEGDSGTLEFQINALKGATRWLETRAAPLRDEHGRVTALLGITRDITERRQAEAALLHSEARFRRVVESDMLGMIFWNAAGEITEANDAFLCIVGYSRDDLRAGRVDWRNLTPPEYQALDEIALRAVAVTGVCAPYEKAYLHQDGSRVPILVGGAALPGAPGQGVAFVLDITERKRTEEKLALQSETLMAVTESLAAYVERGDWREATGRLLRCALSQTQSEYGFVGVVVGTTLRVLAHEGIVWDKILNRGFYEQALRTYEEKGYLEFTNFNNLFGRAITTGQVVIANMPDSDPRSSGRPTGHPPMHSFLGVPIFAGQEVQGMIALANRPGGYSGEEQCRIETLVQHSGGLCTTYRQHEAVLILEQQRLKAETALRESEVNRQLAFEAAKLGDWSWDIVGGEVQWSARCKALHGLNPDTVMNYERFLQAVHPEDRDRIDTALKQAVERRSDYEVEKRTVWPDGSLHWTATRGRVFSDAAGNPIRMAGVSFDITKRKQAEADIVLWKNRYEAVIKASGQILYDWNPVSNEVTYGGDTERVLGYRMEEMTGGLAHWLELVHPDDRDSFNREIERVIAAKQSFHLGYRLRRKDGSFIFTQDDGYFVFDDMGNVTRMVGFVADITGRKAAEEAVRESEERLRGILNTMFVFVGLMDLDGKIVEVNHAPLVAAGLKREDVLGRTVVESFWFSHSPALQAQVSEALACAARGEVSRQDYLIRVADGRHMTIDTTFAPLRDASGRVTQIVGSAMDITERKQAESRIQHLNRVYAVLSDINQNIVRGKNPLAMLAAACRIAVEKGRFRMAWIGLVDAADGRLKITAHAGAADDTLNILKTLIGNEQRGSDCAFTASALQTGQHGICNDIAGDPQAAAWRAAALERDYRAMVSLPLKVGAKVTGTFNLYADVPGFFDADEMCLLDELAMDIGFALEVHDRETERQRVDHALRESEERFRQLAENIQEVFWMTDPAKHQMLYVSPAYEKIWGRTCASLYASPHTWLDAIHPDDRARILHAADTKRTKGDYDETYRIQRPDGVIRWIHDRAFPVRGAAGEILRVVGTAEDITDRRQLEEQFRQSQKMEAIGQLAGGVAHDFNNILAAMMMQAELTGMAEGVSEEMRDGLQQIKADAERAANLTRQLLLFSRKQVMQSCELNLNEAVASLAKMLQRIIGEDVRLQLNLNLRPLLTRADAGMLDQVLMNLVVNARDAMPGGGRLTIETGEKNFTAAEAALIPDASPGRHVCLRVTDTGSGIPPENLKRIFEPFFTTKEPGKGTGLGLATVFGIVKQHGGSLAVESEIGRGTTFQIFLPATEGAGESPGEIAAKPQPRSGTETILLVEDESSVRRLTRIVLERAGYRVLEAAHGVEALKIWEQHRDKIQLLFTDIVMPEGVSGRELATRLLAGNPKLRVVFTSGYSADIAGRELSLQAGQNFIQKPATPDEILETIRRCLASRESEPMA